MRGGNNEGCCFGRVRMTGIHKSSPGVITFRGQQVDAGWVCMERERGPRREEWMGYIASG